MLDINITIINYEWENYNGILRTYIVEPISRWNNYDGDSYHFGLLDFIVDEILVDHTTVVTETWDGKTKGFEDISSDNIMVIAAVFDSENQYVDETTSGTPDDLFAVKITKPTNALYIRNYTIVPFFFPVIFGYINVEVETLNLESEISKVRFYIDDVLKHTDYNLASKIIST